jgi:hypothetical protein
MSKGMKAYKIIGNKLEFTSEDKSTSIIFIIDHIGNDKMYLTPTGEQGHSDYAGRLISSTETVKYQLIHFIVLTLL